MRRYGGLRWLVGHVVVGVLAVAFLRLGWWQWQHARQGNTLSYGYALQWPLFAGFGVFFWTRILRDRVQPQRRTRTAGRGGTSTANVATDIPEASLGTTWAYRTELIPETAVAEPPSTDAAEADSELAAYNAMLAWLARDPDRRFSDYPASRSDG